MPVTVPVVDRWLTLPIDTNNIKHPSIHFPYPLILCRVTEGWSISHLTVVERQVSTFRGRQPIAGLTNIHRRSRVNLRSFMLHAHSAPCRRWTDDSSTAFCHGSPWSMSGSWKAHSNLFTDSGLRCIHSQLITLVPNSYHLQYMLTNMLEVSLILFSLWYFCVCSRAVALESCWLAGPTNNNKSSLNVFNSVMHFQWVNPNPPAHSSNRVVKKYKWSLC